MRRGSRSNGQTTYSSTGRKSAASSSKPRAATREPLRLVVGIGINLRGAATLAARMPTHSGMPSATPAATATPHRPRPPSRQWPSLRPRPPSSTLAATAKPLSPSTPAATATPSSPSTPAATATPSSQPTLAAMAIPTSPVTPHDDGLPLIPGRRCGNGPTHGRRSSDGIALDRDFGASRRRRAAHHRRARSTCFGQRHR